MDRQGYPKATARAGPRPAGSGPDYSKFHDRLDEIAARLDRLAQRAQGDGRAAAEQGAARVHSTSPVAETVDEFDQHVPDAPREPARPASAPGPSFSLDDAIAEISARQQALDAGDAGPAAPAVALPGGEGLLHDITDQIDTLRRPCAVEDSVEALRRELADIGRAAAEPRP